MTISPDNARFLISAVLVVHGLGHGGALGALIWMRAFPDTPTGGWLAARSWLLPALRSSDATNIAMVFWIVAMIGFLWAAASFLGFAGTGSLWRSLATASAIVSLSGMLVFFGTWPLANWLASLAVNLGIVVTQLVTRWPPLEMFGR